MTPEQEKKWLEQGNDKYISRYGKQYGSRSDLVFYTQGFKDAKESSHEIHMIDKESMLILYHLLKTKLGEFIDVEKFLDENSEETPEGFKYHAELVDQLKDRDQEIERLNSALKYDRKEKIALWEYLKKSRGINDVYDLGLAQDLFSEIWDETILPMEKQLKERDELIKKFVSWMTGGEPSKPNGNEFAIEIEKARKMVGE